LMGCRQMPATGTNFNILGHPRGVCSLHKNRSCESWNLWER